MVLRENLLIGALYSFKENDNGNLELGKNAIKKIFFHLPHLQNQNRSLPPTLPTHESFCALSVIGETQLVLE